MTDLTTEEMRERLLDHVETADAVALSLVEFEDGEVDTDIQALLVDEEKLSEAEEIAAHWLLKESLRDQADAIDTDPEHRRDHPGPLVGIIPGPPPQEPDEPDESSGKGLH